MKKGFALPAGMIILLMILLVSFAIIFMILMRMGIIFGSDSDLQLCRLTIAAQERTQATAPGSKASVGVVDSPLTINCKRRVVQITPQKVLLERTGPDQPIATYATGKPAYSYNHLNETVANSFFAESMRRCWYMGLEGKKAIFNPREVGAFGLGETPNTCMICDEIHVNVPPQYEPDKPLKLANYLYTTKIPNSTQTYEEYLFTPTDGLPRSALTETIFGTLDYFTLGFWPDLSPDEQLTLSAQTQCLYENNIDMNPELNAGTYATVYFRSFTRTNTGCQAVYVVPATKLGSLCDYVAN